MTVSHAAIRQDHQQVLTSLAHIGANASRLSLKFDRGAVGKALPKPPVGSHECAPLELLPVLDMLQLVRTSAGDYMPDESEISKVLKEAKAFQLLTIDASAFKLEVLLAVLHHMRKVLFASEEWPGSIAVVVRDEMLDDAMTLLSKTFYSTPTRTSVKEAAVYAYRIHRVASMARFFNLSPRATERAFAIKDRLAQRWMRLTGRDEVDLT